MRAPFDRLRAGRENLRINKMIVIPEIAPAAWLSGIQHLTGEHDPEKLSGRPEAA